MRSRFGWCVAGVILIAWAAGGRPAYALEWISHEVRRGFAYEEFIEVGDAQVADSAIFREGVRLAAHDSDLYEEPSVAAAIYFFEIPADAEFVRVRISYLDRGWRRAPWAGYLWLRDRAVEEEYLAAHPDADVEGFFGQTFVLERDRIEETFWVEADPVRFAGWMEAHLVAAAGNVLDFHWIEVNTYRYAPVTYYCSSIPWVPSWKAWCSSYGYYYVGPWFSRTGGIRYRCWHPYPETVWVGWADYRRSFTIRYVPVARPPTFIVVTGRGVRDLEVSPRLERILRRPGGFPRLGWLHRLKRKIERPRRGPPDCRDRRRQQAEAPQARPQPSVGRVAPRRTSSRSVSGSRKGPRPVVTERAAPVRRTPGNRTPRPTPAPAVRRAAPQPARPVATPRPTPAPAVRRAAPQPARPVATPRSTPAPAVRRAVPQPRRPVATPRSAPAPAVRRAAPQPRRPVATARPQPATPRRASVPVSRSHRRPAAAPSPPRNHPTSVQRARSTTPRSAGGQKRLVRTPPARSN